MNTQVNRQTINKVATHPLQTWEWGAFRKEWGNEVHYFPFGLITIHKLPHVPFKVATFERGIEPTAAILSQLKQFAKQHKILFIKLEPNVLKNKKTETILKKAHAVPGKTFFTPTSFVLDLTKSEEQLLQSFHSKTRYNIRLAQKKGVVISEDNSDKAFQRYLDLTDETTKRQGFYSHTRNYHTLMWKHLHTEMIAQKKEPIARLLTATFNKEIIVTWIVFVWKKTLYYPYGASTDTYKNIMAPNLMMWEAILYGKKHKLTTFDLWGREEGKGFTKFKEGYAPEVIEFIGTWDLVCSPLYTVYKKAEWLRWKLLRLKAQLR